MLAERELASSMVRVLRENNVSIDANKFLTLTEAGSRLAAAAQEWLADYGRLAQRLRPGRRSSVTVTASVGIAALWLIPRLPGFQRAHPDVDVRIAAGNRVVDLAREGIDLALRYCADRDAPAGAHRLFGETVLPVAHPRLARGLTLDAQTLPGLTLLEFDDPGYPWLRWSQWLAAIGLDAVAPRAWLRYSHYDQLIQAAVAGQGVALARSELVAPLFEERRLAAVGERTSAVAGRGYWLIAAPGPLSEEAALLGSWIRATAAGAA
jgi:DNA-binding transcriptional LysR family regulator